MKNKPASGKSGLEHHFQTQGRLLFKACGIRSTEVWNHLIEKSGVDFMGVNFSPKSKRRPDEQMLEWLRQGPHRTGVAVFYQNTGHEIRETIEKYAFKTVQLYAGDVSPELVRTLKVRVIMAVKVPSDQPWQQTFSQYIEPYAADVDCFILDGAQPGSGERIEAAIPEDFPYPFLLAGGMHEDNLSDLTKYRHCIGVDIASGIETNGRVDTEKIARIVEKLRQISGQLSAFSSS
jgi:phosphoribosylanthranilate isomerase